MLKEVDIKAVIGFSGMISIIKELFMMDYYFILTINILYIHLDLLLLLDISCQELRLSYEVMIVKYQVFFNVIKQSRYLLMANLLLVHKQAFQDF
jgi:hypothetical protein